MCLVFPFARLAGFVTAFAFKILREINRVSHAIILSYLHRVLIFGEYHLLRGQFGGESEVESVCGL